MRHGKKIKLGKDVDENKFKEEVAKLKKKLEKGSIKSFFNKPKTVRNIAEDEAIVEAGPIVENENVELEIVVDDNNIENVSDPSLREYDTPAQNKLKEVLAQTEISLAKLIEARNLDLGGDSAVSLTKRINELIKTKEDLKRKVKKLEQNKINQKKA